MTASFPILVVVPTFNSWHLLSSLVESLQSQVYPNWRLLFVDGHSCPDHQNWLDDCCSADSRISWIFESDNTSGIFGAMNDGFSNAAPDEWILFWGSDDWASSPGVFQLLVDTVNSTPFRLPDLLVCSGQYISSTTSKFGRYSTFCKARCLDALSFRKRLFFGAVPAHQATLFGPGSRRLIDSYSRSFKLSADLNYFLAISASSDLVVCCSDSNLVTMSDGGVSGQQTFNRISEVIKAYRMSFPVFWLLPFCCRYIRRILSLVILS